MKEESTQPGQHRAGFVSILGRPNVGKSTLMNRLVGEKLSIITPKAQTTRHRILGILNGDDFQIVYSDTPGILKPEYALHRSMMGFVRSSLEDADVLLFVADPFERYGEEDLIVKISRCSAPKILVLNKTDLCKGDQVTATLEYWAGILNPVAQVAISALTGEGVEQLLPLILEHLPLHPPYYPKDALTDRPERFFAAEILREKIFGLYKKEIPYSSEVIVTEFSESADIIRIRTEIYVERKSQRAILLGHKGERIKQTGIAARTEMEAFFGKKVFLEQHIKVQPNWRRDERQLRHFGYS